jgi:putative RecB family exonuclease
MRKFSHSRLSSYESCPLQYRLRYVDQIPVPPRESVEAFLGRQVHASLEQLYKSLEVGHKPSLEETLEHFRQAWNGAWTEAIHIVRASETPAGYKKIGERCLIHYYRRHDPFDRGRTVGAEFLITYALAPERDLYLQGLVDRLVDLGEGDYEIHDYKTSRRLPSQEDVDRDRQLGIYQMAVTEQFADARSVRLVWHYLAHDRVLTSTRTPEDLRGLRDQVLGLIAQIDAATEAGSFPANSSPLCHWCEFQPVCPAWNPEPAIALSAAR